MKPKEEVNDLTNEWKVDTANLLRLLLEQNPQGSVLVRPVQVFRDLLIKLTERALEINDKELNKILQRLCLVEKVSDR